MRLWPTLSVRRETGSMQISIYICDTFKHIWNNQNHSIHHWEWKLAFAVIIFFLVLWPWLRNSQFQPGSDNGNIYIRGASWKSCIANFQVLSGGMSGIMLSFFSQSTPMLLSGVGPHLIHAFVGSHSSLYNFLRWTIYNWTARNPLLMLDKHFDKF